MQKSNRPPYKLTITFYKDLTYSFLKSALVKFETFSAQATCNLNFATGVYKGNVTVPYPTGVTKSNIKGVHILLSKDTTYGDTYNWVSVNDYRDNGFVLVAWSNANGRIINIIGFIEYV